MVKQLDMTIINECLNKCCFTMPSIFFNTFSQYHVPWVVIDAQKHLEIAPYMVCYKIYS